MAPNTARGSARSLEFYVILTADGMYADPDGGLDHYDPAEDEHRFANELLRASGGEIMGRRMYDVMDYWDELDVSAPATPEVEREYAELWRETPKYVASRGSASLRANAQVLTGDVVEVIRALKPKTDHRWGSAAAPSCWPPSARLG